MFHTKFGFDWPRAVSEKQIFEVFDGLTTDDRPMPDHAHPISSPCELNGSGELKMYQLSVRYKVKSLNHQIRSQ